MNPKRINELPEGHTVSQGREYFSEDELRTADIAGRGRPDILCTETERYRVHGVSAWTQGGFFHYTLLRVGQ